MVAQVKENNTVKVHYKGKLNSGEVFDSSEGREPLEFKVGEGRVIPGFEQAVVGMEANETKTVTIPSNEAYGPVRDDLVNKIDKKQLPEGLKPEPGMDLVSKLPDGSQMILKVLEVNDENIVVDANHPLAGKDLTFEITVVEIG